MALSSIRLRYHLVNTTIVLVLLGAFQLWRSSFDPQFLVIVGGLYLAIVLAIDVIRPIESEEGQ